MLFVRFRWSYLYSVAWCVVETGYLGVAGGDDAVAGSRGGVMLSIVKEVCLPASAVSLRENSGKGQSESERNAVMTAGPV